MQRIKQSFVILFFISIGPVLSGQTQGQFDSDFQLFLDKYLAAGMLDYQKAISDKNELNNLDNSFKKYLSNGTIGAFDYASLINIYNAGVILKVCENYPLSSVQKLPGFFDEKFIHFKDSKKSFNELEQYLLANFGNPGLHFVLNCGAISCPPLREEIFDETNLETQIDDAATRALKEPSVLLVDIEKKNLHVSKIFDWYAKDFEAAGGVLTYIIQHAGNSQIDHDFRLSYQAYNWTLNDLNLKDEDVNRAYSVGQLLSKGKTELKVFNAMYTQRNFAGRDAHFSRSTFFSSYVQFLYGINETYNAGIDLVYKSNRIHDLPEYSPFRSLNPMNVDTLYLDENDMPRIMGYRGQTHNSTYAAGFSHIGPKIKFEPFKKIQGLSMQQTLYIPIQNNVDPTWVSFTQFFYDRKISSNQQLFAELSFWVNLAPEFRVAPFPKVFYSYFPNSKWTIYGTTTGLIEWGLGGKYYIGPNLEIEALVTHYLPFEFVQPGRRASTFNFGLRYSNN